MISLEELNNEIESLEEKAPTYAIMQQLASLYVVRDHMPVYESDFAEIAYRDMNKTLAVMDELMRTLAVINPKLYDGVMRQLM